MSRNGFALISTLWLLAALSAMLAVGLEGVSTSRMASENRIHLRRAKWAASACVSYVQAGAAHGELRVPLDSLAIGPDQFCSVRDVSPRDRLNLNARDSVGLSRVFTPIQLGSLSDWIDPDDEPRPDGAERAWYSARGRRAPRNAPLMSVRELVHVRGFESLSPDRLDASFTVQGDGRVAPNSAPEHVLRTVGVLSPAQIVRVMALRSTGRVFVSEEDLAHAVGLVPTIPEFQDLVQRLTFDTAPVTFRAVGSSKVGSRVVTHSIEAAVSLLPTRR